MGRGVDIEGTANVRDLGGVARTDGSITPHGVFYRSAGLDRLTSRGWEDLYRQGIRTVVDLRQAGERAADVGPRPNWLNTRAVDLDGLDDHPEFWDDMWSTGLMATALYYLPHLAALPERWAEAVTAVVTAPPGGVLFHCSAGRDRTGIVALVLLTAASATPEGIVDDYMETVRLEPQRRAAGVTGVFTEADLEDLLRPHGSSTEGAFRQALEGYDPTAVTGLLDQTARHALHTWRGALA